MSTETREDQRLGQVRPLAGALTLAGALFSGLIRLIPHPMNMTPITATGLFAGARLPLWQALGIPLALLVSTDVILKLTYYPTYSMFQWWVYLSVAINVLLGRLLCRTESPARIGLVALIASVQFFVVTNFGSWLGSPFYTQDLQGLVTCYVAGLAFPTKDTLPLGFFGNQVMGDLIFTGVLFGAHAYLSRVALVGERVPATRSAS
jgi:Family of unknown function (DUF6580)